MANDHTHTVDEGLAQRIAVLADLEALRALKHHYAETVDACVSDPSEARAALVTALFAADADADYGQFGQFHGHDGLTTFMRTVLPSVVSWTRHFMMNPILAVDGRRATGRWYATVHGVFKANPAGGPQTLYVRYEETYTKTDRGWQFQTIVVHYDTPS